MANILKSFLDTLKLVDDDDDDFEDDDFEEEVEVVRKPIRRERKEKSESTSISEQRMAKRTEKERVDTSEKLETKRERPMRTERSSNNKIIPIRTTSKGSEVCIIKPTIFEDAQDICDMLLGGRAVVVNLEGFDPAEAQKIVDFVAGAIYAINGKLHSISRYIFIFSPDSIDISGDFSELLPGNGLGVPLVNREY